MNAERPVSQVVVFGSASPISRSDAERRLHQMGFTVWTREPHWVIGTVPLPGSEPDPDQFVRRGLAFVEGRDRVEAAYGTEAPERVVKLAGRAAALAQIPGDFTFAHVDGEAVQLVRSCAGMGHWFIHHGDDCVIAATRLRFFEDVLEREMALDELVLATWTMDGILPWNRTPLAGVSVVPPAHTAILRMHAPTIVERYWDPADIEPAQQPCRTGELARRTREVIVGHLDRDLSRTAPNIVTFSGGVDSSIVVAIGKRLGRHIETVSVLPTDQFATPEPTLRSVSTFLEAVPVDAHWPHVLDEHSWVETLLAAPAMRVPMMNPALILGGQHGSSSSAAVMSGGEYADELFGGWNTFYKGWLSSLSWRDVAHSVRHAEGLNRVQVLRSRFRQIVKRNSGRLAFKEGLPPYIRPDLREEFAQFVAESVRDVRRLDHPRSFMIMGQAQYCGWLLQNWEISSEFDMRRSTPFHTRESLELSFSSHPLDLAWPPKRLLRAAFDGLVPSSHLHRVEKDSFGQSPLASVPLELGLVIPEVVAGILDPRVIDVSKPLLPDVAEAVAPVIVASHRPGRISCR